MVTAGEIQVWRIAGVDPHLEPHRALRAILAATTTAAIDFAVSPQGKPYLPHALHIKFNLSHTRGMALVAVALDVEVGVDVEQRRPVPDYKDIAGRFFPPSEAAALLAGPPESQLNEFFRRWTLIEARLKARGVGLYGAGAELPGPWTLQEIDAGAGFAAAVAATRAGMRIAIQDFTEGHFGDNQ